jgi:parallel beta-helix repeat protein
VKRRGALARAALCAGAAMIAGAGVTVLTVGLPASAAECIPSGSEAAVQAALSGAGAQALLCPGAVIQVSHTITFTAPNQVIATQGLPTDATRATLRLASSAITSVVSGGNRSGVTLENIQADGQLATLGRAGGGALVELGGGATGQVVQHDNLHDTRSWSTLHIAEGAITNSIPQCQQAKILDNTIGPAGVAATNQWSDGISLACGNSTVQGNTVQDATDGGIVVFGAPGSTITQNTVQANTRTLLGGSNLVDYAPMNGNYTGTKVTGNTIDAKSAFIKVGVAMGPNIWGCSTNINYGATVTGNTLTGDHMGYGYAVNGVRDFTVSGNVDTSHHVGAIGNGCNGLPSEPKGFQVQNQTGSTLQSQFTTATLGYLLAITENPASGSVISLRSHADNDYVTADSAGTKPLIANRTTIGPWEQFDLLNQTDGTVALRSHANNDYVTAGTASLVANSTTVGAGQKFTLVHNSDGSVSLKAAANGDYVTADGAGTKALIANRTAIGPWEEFDLIQG